MAAEDEGREPGEPDWGTSSACVLRERSVALRPLTTRLGAEVVDFGAQPKVDPYYRKAGAPL
ncbi:MAG: hypothetical protein ACRDSP_13560 [Pseudonocardiaceae bacterium]